MKFAWEKAAVVFSLTLFIISVAIGSRLASGKTNPSPSLPGTIGDTPVVRKVLMLTFNPIIESHGAVSLSNLQSWSDPDVITNNLLQGFGTVSHNYLKYKIVERQAIDDFPVKSDGFKYTDETYLECLQDPSACHDPDGIDYQLLFSTYNICAKGVDEVWLWGAPYFGFWEFHPVTLCGKTMFVMGFSYERAAGEAWHDFGHRMEFVNIHRIGGGQWQQDESNEWNKFSLIDGHCGNIHYPPGSIVGLDEYKYDKADPVTSDCDGYLNFPTGPFEPTTLTCSAWGCDQEGYVRWWLHHFPSSAGTTTSYGKTIYNNWWKYYVFYDETASGQFSELSAQLEPNQATFNFSFSTPASGYTIDVSPVPDMSFDTYLSFVSGISSPVVEANPTRWDTYVCGVTLYWVVRTTTGVTSPIQTARVSCN